MRPVGIALLCASLTSLGWTAPTAAGPESPQVHLLVPAYFYPSGDGEKAWSRLIETSTKAPIVAIVDPANGPGKLRDPNYERVFERAKGSKLKLIGYVKSESLAQGAAFVYVTDASGANPWDRLPSYWEAELAEVSRRNDRP